MDDVDLAALRDIADPLTRARRAHLAIPLVEQIRNEAMADAYRSAVTQAVIAEELHITPARVSQILRGRPGPWRAFWGAEDGELIMAVAEKTEGPKPAAGRPGPVFAAEDTAASAAIRESVTEMGIRVDRDPEVVRPPGFIDLNRAGLVVICGPRHSPMISQILASDRNLAFRRDEAGWYLRDLRAGTDYRSPWDDGRCSDVAYLGRLPRPDARGDFLYMAGIHASGEAGVAHYLTTGGGLEEAWREVGKRRFSVLIGCEFADEGHRVISSKRLTPYYESA